MEKGSFTRVAGILGIDRKTLYNLMAKVQMHSVESSNIAKIGYDETKEELYIVFHTGSTYKYSPVGPESYRAFMAADSFGQFFAKYIKNNPGVTYEKL